MENFNIDVLGKWNELLEFQIILNGVQSASEIFSSIPQKLTKTFKLSICTIFSINKYTKNLAFCCNSEIEKSCENYFNLKFLNLEKEKILNNHSVIKIKLENGVNTVIEQIAENSDYIYFLAFSFEDEQKSELSSINNFIKLIKCIVEKSFEIERLKKSRIIYDEFMKKVSHEIKTPLNAICQQAKLIQTRHPETDEHAERIIYSGNHLLMLVNDILDNKGNDGINNEIKKIEFPAKKVIEDTFLSMKVIMASKNLKIAFKNIDTTIFADIKMFRQLVFNLAGNAVKFSEPGSEIEVLSYLTDNKFWLEVKNHGQTISDKDKENIFELYARGFQTAKENYSGNGIGLNICKRIAEAHDGSIDCLNEVPNQTTFVISIACENTHSLAI